LRRASLRAPSLPPQGRGRYPLALAGQDRPIQRSAHPRQARDLPRYPQRSPCTPGARMVPRAGPHRPTCPQPASRGLATPRQALGPRGRTLGSAEAVTTTVAPPVLGRPASTGTHARAKVITCTSPVAATASAHRPTDVHIRMIRTHLPHRRFSWSAAHSRRSARCRAWNRVTVRNRRWSAQARK